MLLDITPDVIQAKDIPVVNGYELSTLRNASAATDVRE